MELFGRTMEELKAMVREHELLAPLRNTPAYAEMLALARVHAAQKRLDQALRERIAADIALESSRARLAAIRAASSETER